MFDAIGKTDTLDQLVSTLHAVGVWTTVGNGRDEHIFQHRELWKQVVVLEDETNVLVSKAGQGLLVQLKWIRAIEDHGAAGGNIKCAEDV